MGKIQRVMAACDMSPYAVQVILYAAEIAEKMNAGLIIANVLNQRDVNVIVEAKSKMALLGNKFSVSVDDYVGTVKKERLQELKKMVGDLRRDHLDLKYIFSVGVPYQKLIAIAREERADVVVMGTRGRTNLADVLFGSTAEKMFRLCPVPLLSVRLFDEREPQE